jgi:anti-anti-sigma factor
VASTVVFASPSGVRAGPTPTVRAEGTSTVVVLRGESDFCTISVLSDVLSRVLTMRSGDVVIDLADAEFIDSSPVGALAAAQQSLDRQHRQLTFRSPSRLAARVLQVFGLSDLIETRERA